MVGPTSDPVGAARYPRGSAAREALQAGRAGEDPFLVLSFAEARLGPAVMPDTELRQERAASDALVGYCLVLRAAERRLGALTKFPGAFRRHRLGLASSASAPHCFAVRRQRLSVSSLRVVLRRVVPIARP